MAVDTPGPARLAPLPCLHPAYCHLMLGLSAPSSGWRRCCRCWVSMARHCCAQRSRGGVSMVSLSVGGASLARSAGPRSVLCAQAAEHQFSAALAWPQNRLARSRREWVPRRAGPERPIRTGSVIRACCSVPRVVLCWTGADAMPMCSGHSRKTRAEVAVD